MVNERLKEGELYMFNLEDCGGKDASFNISEPRATYAGMFGPSRSIRRYSLTFVFLSLFYLRGP